MIGRFVILTVVVLSSFLPTAIAAEDRICFPLYTVYERILKLTAQSYSLKNYENGCRSSEN